MNKKYYIISGVIFLTLVVFVFINENKGNYYKKSVEDTYALLVNSDVNISARELQEAGPEILKVNVVLEGEENELNNYISIRLAHLLDRKFLKRLQQHKGTIVIVSEDAGLVTNAWVLITRKGFDNIKILGVKENETFKYTFEPETKEADSNDPNLSF